MERRKTIKLLLAFAIFILIGPVLQAQCNIQSNEQGEGYTTYYLNPELIAQDNEFGIAMSVQSVADKYYLALTYRFARQAKPLEEKVAIELMNGYTLELEMYTMQVGNAGGVELCMAVYNIESEVIPYFKSSELKAVKFNTLEGSDHRLPVNENAGALKRQLRCFGL